jgi:hypothetical protein
MVGLAQQLTAKPCDHGLELGVNLSIGYGGFDFRTKVLLPNLFAEGAEWGMS